MHLDLALRPRACRNGCLAGADYPCPNWLLLPETRVYSLLLSPPHAPRSRTERWYDDFVCVDLVNSPGEYTQSYITSNNVTGVEHGTVFASTKKGGGDQVYV